MRVMVIVKATKESEAGGWGAVGKSNFTGLRYREPVYRSVRELVMSYFEDYFNADGERTLRMHTSPLRLARFDRLMERYGFAVADAVEEGAHFLDLCDVGLAIDRGVGANLKAELFAPLDHLDRLVEHAGAVHHHQPRGVARLERRLGDQLGRQVVIELVSA